MKNKVKHTRSNTISLGKNASSSLLLLALPFFSSLLSFEPEAAETRDEADAGAKDELDDMVRRWKRYDENGVGWDRDDALSDASLEMNVSSAAAVELDQVRSKFQRW